MNFELSYTEENYIKAIYHLSEGLSEEVSTNALAESMQTRPATVTNMIKRLSEKKVVEYEKYQGVQLTETGKSQALQIVRKHRLWEVFLVEKLKFNWDEVHEIAEELEHIKSPLLVKRLDEFLGNPKVDPHGDPIPDEDGVFHTGPSVLLTDMQVCEKGVIIGVSDSDPRLLQYLDKINFHLGMRITILDKVEFDGSMEIEPESHPPLFLSKQVASQLTVRKLN